MSTENDLESCINIRIQLFHPETTVESDYTVTQKKRQTAQL